MWNKSKEAQTTVITTLSHIHSLSTIKGKLKSREEKCKYKITPRHVIKEEIKELDEKPFHNSPSRSKIYSLMEKKLLKPRLLERL